MNRMNYNITRHCAQRYIERVCGGLNASTNLYKDIIRSLNSATNITSKLSTDVPRFLLYVKERYGTDKGFNFLKNDHIIYVLTKRKGTEKLYDVLTCYIENNLFDKFKNTALSKEQIHMKLSMLKKS